MRQEEGGSPKEGQRISTELGASGGYSETNHEFAASEMLTKLRKKNSQRKVWAAIACLGNALAITVHRRKGLSTRKGANASATSGKRVKGLV